jgi:protease I
MDKKCLIVIPARDFNDQEYQDIREVLDAEGAIVKVATTAVEEAIGISSTHVVPDVSFDNVSVEEYDAIIFVSGPGVFEYYNNSTVLDLVRHFYREGKLVAAISRAVEVLARAGVLSERRATIHPEAKQALLSRNIGYTGEDLTIDQNVITASGVAYGHKFSQAIAGFLKI